MNESKTLTEIIKNVKSWMSEYNPSVLYKWVTVISIHPSNQKFQIRFEFLLAILTSINIEEFKNKKLDYQILSSFISKFKKETDSIFFRVEDFTPFPQLKLIPYFFERNKYYFFYGQMERMYESIRILEKIYICETEEHPELILIKDLFKQILNYQTRILNKLVQIEESKEVFEDAIYLPTENFFGEIEELLEIGVEKILDSRFTLHFRKERNDIVENFEKILYGGYFEDLYLELSKSVMALILPHIHLEVLYKIFEKIVSLSKNKDSIQKTIQINVIYNIMDVFLKFFNKRDLMDFILNVRGECISNESSLIVLFENNLFLFDIVDLFSTLDLSARINKSHERLKKIEQNILNERIIHIKFAERYHYEVPANEINIIKIIVYEPIDLTPGPILFDFQTDSRMTIISIKDLIGIFELTSSPLKFIKFLEEKYSSGRFLTFDQIDIFAAFYNNNESLPASGTGFISLATHLWSDFYNNYLMEKYDDSIYELIELDIPNKFTDVKKWMDSQDLYECIDKRDLFSANIIKLDNGLIWIFNPHIDPILKSEDYEVAMRVIGPLYADYIQRIIKPFEELISRYTSIKEYSIFLTPHKICEAKPFLNQFERDYCKVNEENPIIVKSFINTYSKLISNVFYNYEFWGDKFSDSSNNENARYAIRQLIFSIIEHFEPSLSEEEAYNKTDDFLRANFINAERDYYLEAIPARNINIKKYPSYLKINSTDQEKVIKEVEAYLREKNFTQGHLTPEESKNLFNEIYLTFYEKLKDILSHFDISLLYYAYKQLESVEGKRYIIKLEAGMKIPSQIDELYKNYFEKNYDEINKLSSTHRFIISNILKFGIKGTKKISAVEYSYIQALSLYLVSISQISDFTFSKLIEYTINIRAFYKFDELRSSSIFDYDAYKEVESKSKLDATKNFYNNLISEPEMANETFNVPEKEKILITNIEEAFQSQFSFSFTNMMRILSLLSSSNQINDDIMMFPSILIDKEGLVKLLQDEYKKEYGTRPTFIGDLINLVGETEIRTILEFLSLDFKSFEEEDILLHLKIMKQKNRLTLCPLIDINNQFLFGKQCCNVAFQIWRRNIFAGVFPFKIPVNDEISVALQKLHSYQDTIFEDECGEIAEEALGNGKSIIRLKNFKRISESLPKYPNCGEIDLLAVNPDTKICFVLDSKNYFLRLSPGDIKNEINRFITRKKSDLIKLEKKEKFIRNNIDFFLDYFKINDRQSWNFKKGFVIKYNFPSAYVKDIEADFIFQSDLENYLKNQ